MKTKWIKMNPSIVDTTLRDGEKASGIVFSTKEKIAIASLLDELSIDEIEIGIPSHGMKEINSIRAVIGQGFHFRTSTWCRATKKDIDAARKTGVDGVNISYPVSETQLKIIGRDWKWMNETMPQIVSYAKNYFKYVSVGAQDASLANIDSLSEFIHNCFNLHVFRVRISDTAGILTPISSYQLISDLKKAVPFIPLEFHGHNETMGMATANTLSAIEAGAEYASTTVNGLGERPGNAATEELILALYLSGNYKIKYKTKSINELCRFVADVILKSSKLSTPILENKELKHKLGIHSSILTERNIYQLHNINLMAGRQKSDFTFGKHVGSNALISLYKSKFMTISDEDVIKTLDDMNEKSLNINWDLAQDDLLQLFANV